MSQGSSGQWKFCFAIFLCLCCSKIGVAQEIPPELGKCQEFNRHAVLTRACDAFLEGTEVYTAPGAGVTQQTLYATLLEPGSLGISPLAPLIGMPFDCGAAYMRFECSKTFRGCAVGEDNYAVRLAPCRSACEDMASGCADFFADLGVPVIDCSGWPEASSNATQCNMVPRETMDNFSYECPEPLEFNRDGDPLTGLPCSITCLTYVHLALGSEQDLKNAEIVLAVFGWISVVLLGILAITYALFPPTRQFPRHIVLCICIPLMYTNLAITMSTWTSRENYYCENNFRWRHTTGWCVATSFVTFWSSLAAGLWWTAQAFVLFWNVALMRRSSTLNRLAPYFHIVCWGIPTIIVIISISVFGTVQGSGYPICGDDSGDNIWTWCTVYAPLFTMLVAVFVMVSACMWKLFRASNFDQTFWNRWKSQLQLLLFTLAYFGTVLSFLIFPFWTESVGADLLADSFPKWYACVYAGGGDDCELEDTIHHGIYWNSIFWLSSMGIWIFCVFFILNSYNRNLWALAYLNWRDGRPVFENIDNPSSHYSSRMGNRRGTSTMASTIG